MTGPRPLSTVATAFTAIEALWRLDGAGVSELAGHLGMPKSTVHDYLRTLTNTGYVVNDGGEYRLSSKFLQIGGRLRHRMALFHAVKPELHRIATETGEVANLTVEDDGHAVIVYSVIGDNGLNLGEYPGLHTPIHSHASGKAILSTFSAERIAEIIDRRGLQSVTDKTVSTRPELHERLETVRTNGYCVDKDEQVHGMGVVAAPVNDNRGNTGAIGIVCPSYRLAEEEYVQELADAARNAVDLARINLAYG